MYTFRDDPRHGKCMGEIIHHLSAILPLRADARRRGPKRTWGGQGGSAPVRTRRTLTPRRPCDLTARHTRLKLMRKLSDYHNHSVKRKLYTIQLI